MDQAKQIEDLVKIFNWSDPSWSLFIILGWLGFSVLYALASGRGRTLSLLMSTYAAKLVTLHAILLQGFVDKRLSGIQTSSLRQLVIFAAVFLVSFIVFSKYGFKTHSESRGLSIVFVVVFALLQMGLLFSIVLSYLPSGVLAGFAPLVYKLFLQQYAELVWTVLPIIFLGVFGKFVSSKEI